MFEDEIMIEDHVFIQPTADSPNKVGILGILNANDGFEAFQIFIGDKSLIYPLTDHTIEDNYYTLTEEENERVEKEIARHGGREGILKIINEAYDEAIENRPNLSDEFKELNKGTRKYQ